ncbi:MAG: Hpt domain-containing protein [Clostridia bacterium]|nr:Hpt domain-containing protein [Clostridia bacterium]
MITIEKLAAYGADTKSGLARCMNNEAFYLRLVNMELADANFDKLRAALAAGDAHGAFEAAHALKGTTGNLSLTPVFDPVSELTEKLRGADVLPDLDGLGERVLRAYETLKALAE